MAEHAVALGLVDAVAAWLTFTLAVPRLPEPLGNESWAKPPYCHLPTVRNQLLVALCGALAGTCATQAPIAAWPALIVLGGPVAALVAVDALTTYLPRILSHRCGLLLALALITGSMGSHDWSIVGRGGLAGGCALAFFWILWRLGLGFGFGDVRLVGLIGAAAGAVGLDCAVHALLLGTVIGAVWGLLIQLWRRRHPHPLGNVFAYGPSLWCGLWAALVLR